jgi:hypothetical protein
MSKSQDIIFYFIIGLNLSLFYCYLTSKNIVLIKEKNDICNKYDITSCK